VAAVMEHIEPAGVHSGDSACVIPSLTISKDNLARIEDYSRKIAKELNVRGIMNIQFAICDGKVYILEANPRASRTVPIVSKITNLPIARIATLVMLDSVMKDFPELKKVAIPYFGVKEAVFPFNMFPDVDPLLGPEMRATGEVMGISESFGSAFYKAQEATGAKLPTEGTVLFTVSDRDKAEIVSIAGEIKDLGFTIYATEGTALFLNDKGIETVGIKKIHEGRPNISDEIKNGAISFIVNTPLGKSSMYDDSFIRMMAIQQKIPYITSIAAAKASVEGIRAAKGKTLQPRSLQEYYRDLP
jgi:carbamoyl-phosphate synthase large subunit